MTPITPDEFRALQRRIAAVEHTVATLIAWTAQSAASPISRSDAEKLLRMIGGDVDAPTVPPV